MQLALAYLGVYPGQRLPGIERGRRCVVEGERRCGLLESDGTTTTTKVGQRIGTVYVSDPARTNDGNDGNDSSGEGLLIGALCI